MNKHYNVGKNNPMYGKTGANRGKFKFLSPNWKGGFPKCEDCGKTLKNRYAKKCKSCHFLWAKKHYKDYNFPSRKNKLNPMYGKKRLDLIKWNKLHPQKGKNNPAYKDGRTLIEKFCKDCGKRLFSYKSLRCRKCHFKIRKLWNKGKKIGNKICKHHLDLNKKNNLKQNILKLTNSQHQQFHRWTYHYLLKKFGIQEIIEYKHWFFKQRGKN